ncbi:MAG TPA: pyridoxal-phosphate dependent enzyme [Steroidobacteraceae bacterium]|nr:pyridoxal-phosphate dependent enzyme [Steroidobacteraceae bacterium]
MSESRSPLLTLAEIKEAAARIRPFVHRTPVLTSETLDARVGARLYFKCENFQRVGAFKARGAHNAVFSLSEAEARHGVVTHSSGNHGAAVALAARNRGIPAFVVMPASAPRVKQEAVARYGARVTLCEPTLAAREHTGQRIVEETGAHFVHPYNDLRVIAGQGTTALELLDQVPDLDLIVCPVGGGGQLSGVAVAAKSLSPRLRIVGAEPAAADDARRSLAAGVVIAAGDPQTICDGLRSSLGELSFALIRAWVDEIVTASEPAIIEAMRLVWEIMKIVIEPSSAVPVATLLERSLALSGERVGVILSGGNVDLDRLPWARGAAV